MYKAAAILSLALLLAACGLFDDDDSGNPATNSPPTVELSASPASGSAPLEVTLTAMANDPDGDALSYSWSLEGLPDAATVTTELTEVGEYPITVTVSDGENEVDATTTVTVTGDETDPTDSTDPSDATDPTDSTDPSDASDPSDPTDPEPQITVEASPGGPMPWMVHYNYSATNVPEDGSISLYCGSGIIGGEDSCLHTEGDVFVEVRVMAGEVDNFEVLASETFKPKVEPAGEVPFAGTWKFTSGSETPITFEITQAIDSESFPVFFGGSDTTGDYSISYYLYDAAGELDLSVGEISAFYYNGDFYIDPLEDGTQRFVSSENWEGEPFILEKID